MRQGGRGDGRPGRGLPGRARGARRRGIGYPAALGVALAFALGAPFPLGRAALAAADVGQEADDALRAADDLPAATATPAPSAERVERLDLSECVRRGLAAAPELAVARWDVTTREAKLHEARMARFLPEAQAVDLTGIARRARGTVLNPQDTVDTSAYGPFTRVEVNVVQPVFTGGKITAGIAAATHAVEAEMAASERVEGDVIEQVKTLYYNILLARSVAGTLEETRDAFQSALDTARRRRESGDSSISELDILYLRVGLSEVAKEVPKLQGSAQSALEALRRAMGADPLAPIDLKAKTLEPANAKLEPMQAYAERLFAQSPEWKQIDAGVLAKQEEVRTVEADFYPELFFTGSFIYSYAPRRDRQLNPFAYDNFNIQEGPGALFGIRWLLNFHITDAKVQTARAELGKLEAQRRQAQTGLPLELKTAYSKVQQTRESVEKLKDGRKAGRAILTLAVTNFDVGVGDARDILDGLSNYAHVSSDYFEAVRDYDVALAALSKLAAEEVTDLKIAKP